jgi:tetratricopeptide (TPR) repeat protein
MKKILILILIKLIAFNSYSQTSAEYNAEGSFLVMMEKYDEAIASFNKAIKMDNNPLAYIGRGEAKFELGDFRGALEDLNQGIPRLTTSTVTAKEFFFMGAYKYRGLSKAGLEDCKGAINDLSKALEYVIGHDDTEIYPIYFVRGVCKLVIGDKNGACLDWSKSGELGYAKAYESIRDYCN